MQGPHDGQRACGRPPKPGQEVRRGEGGAPGEVAWPTLGSRRQHRTERRGGGRDPHRAGPAGPTIPRLAFAPEPGAGWLGQMFSVGSGTPGTPGTPLQLPPFTGPPPGPPSCSDSAHGDPPRPASGPQRRHCRVPGCFRKQLHQAPGARACGLRSRQPQPSPTTAGAAHIPPGSPRSRAPA